MMEEPGTDDEPSIGHDGNDGLVEMAGTGPAGLSCGAHGCAVVVSPAVGAIPAKRSSFQQSGAASSINRRFGINRRCPR